MESLHLGRSSSALESWKLKYPIVLLWTSHFTPHFSCLICKIQTKDFILFVWMLVLIRTLPVSLSVTEEIDS